MQLPPCTQRRPKEAVARVEALGSVHATETEEAAARVEALSSEVAAFSALLTDIAKLLAGTLPRVGSAQGVGTQVGEDGCRQFTPTPRCLRAGGAPHRAGDPGDAGHGPLDVCGCSDGAARPCHGPVRHACMPPRPKSLVGQRVWFDAGGHFRLFPQLVG